MENKFMIIPGHGTYLVSSSGVVKNSRGNIMKTYLSDRGYVRIALYINGKCKQVGVHRLVALAWIGIPEVGIDIVNHKDGVKTNNNDWNLEWTTYKGNSDHAFETGLNPRGSESVHAKLTEADVYDILCKKRDGMKPRAIYNSGYKGKVGYENLRDIYRRRSWKHVSV